MYGASVGLTIGLFVNVFPENIQNKNYELILHVLKRDTKMNWFGAILVYILIWLLAPIYCFVELLVFLTHI